MSGYSPTWTNKGSDKLRALQITKILMNSLKRIISSFDISKDSDGFGLDSEKAKLFVAGVARRPEDVAASVRDATGAAAKSFAAAGRS